MRRFVLVTLLALAGAPGAGAATPRVPAGTRASIDRVLDTFVPAAIGRHHAERAYHLATPELRGDSTRAQWGRGDVPVSPYPAVGSGFHDWNVDSASRNSVTIDMVLRPPPRSKQEVTAWTLELRRIRGRWLVQFAMPVAFFPRSGSGSGNLHAWNDLLPQARMTRERHGREGAVWFVVPGVFLLLLVAFPLVLALVGWRRRVRAYRRYPTRALS